MARIAGVDLPREKRVEVALTYIYGIGRNIADDIIEAGITDDQQRAEYLLSLLPDVIHQKPGNNERKALLSYAKKFNKSKFRVAFRDVKWLR